MNELKLFGCHDFYTGGKIVGCITFVENAVRAAISLIFLMWAAHERKTQNLGREIFHAEIYAAVGLIGAILSILLICGISKLRFKLFVPWILFQLVIICYQVYFSFEIIKSGAHDLSNYTTLFITTIFIFHTMFECYYLCLIIGLSQIVANIKVIQQKDDLESLSFSNLKVKFSEFAPN